MGLISQENHHRCCNYKHKIAQPEQRKYRSPERKIYFLSAGLKTQNCHRCSQQIEFLIEKFRVCKVGWDNCNWIWTHSEEDKQTAVRWAAGVSQQEIESAVRGTELPASAGLVGFDLFFAGFYFWCFACMHSERVLDKFLNNLNCVRNWI